MFKGVDKNLSASQWKDFPPTILIHGDKDELAPFVMSSKLVDIFGKLLPVRRKRREEVFI